MINPPVIVCCIYIVNDSSLHVNRIVGVWHDKPRRKADFWYKFNLTAPVHCEKSPKNDMAI